MTPRGTLGLCGVYITQLMTHTAIYKLPFTLQLCYKPLGILQRITESQRVHISSHNRRYTKAKIYLPLTLKRSRKIGSLIKSWFRLSSVSNGLSLMLKKSRKIGPVIRSRFRLNSVSNGLSLILKKSRKIGSVIRSWFRLNSVSNGLSLILKKSRKIGFTTK